MRGFADLSGWGARSWWRPELALTGLIGIYVAVFGWQTWIQQSNFGTFDFDMGVFDQEIWLAAHHLNPFVTVRGLNMWANHVNPIAYLLVPFYWLGAGPHFLYLLQTVALAGTAVPLWLLARDRFARPWLALGVPLAWLLYPAVEWMTWWPFQPEYLATPAFVFAYWFADRHRWIGYWVCVGLVLGTKEDAALAVIALGVVLVARRRVKMGLITVAVAVAWFLICLEVIIRIATPSATPFFLYQYSAFGSSTWQIIGNVVRRPWLIWDTVMRWSHVHYYLQMIAPTAFLALLSPLTLLLVVPSFLVNALNNQGYALQIRYQYTALIAPGLFIAVIEGVARFRGPLTRALRAPMIAALCACALASNVVWSPSPLDASTYHSGIWSIDSSPRIRELAALIARVPADANVTATYTVVPHLTHRDRIFTWPNPWIRSYYGVSDTEPTEHPGIVNYLVLDLTEVSGASVQQLHQLIGPGGPFRVLVNKDQALLAVRVRRRGG
ncbi:MAG: DUF2079 domain-containing protein [Acidimicrobiales bacterium]